MKENKELKVLARSQLKGSWGLAIGVVFMYCLIVGASSCIAVGPFILGGPLALGLAIFFLNKARGEAHQFNSLFEGFNNFGSSLVLYLLQALFITLWSCLFIIPGLIKSLSYSMAFYILKDNPEIGGNEAITRSRKMMNGYKFKLFCLYFSFIGWIFLCCLSFCIGFIFLLPYMELSVANFYEDLKKNQQDSIQSA